MKRRIAIILLFVAFVLFVLAALGVSVSVHVNLLAAGLACWVAALLVPSIPSPPPAG